MEGALVNVAVTKEGVAEGDSAEAVSSALAAELDAPETFASSRAATSYANRALQAADSSRFGVPMDLLAQILLRCVENGGLEIKLLQFFFTVNIGESTEENIVQNYGAQPRGSLGAVGWGASQVHWACCRF